MPIPLLFSVPAPAGALPAAAEGAATISSPAANKVGQHSHTHTDTRRHSGPVDGPGEDRGPCSALEIDFDGALTMGQVTTRGSAADLCRIR